MDNGQTNMVVNKRLHCNDLPPISCCYFRPYLDSKECRPSVLTPRNRFLVQQGSIYVREATGSASQVDLCRLQQRQHLATDDTSPRPNGKLNWMTRTLCINSFYIIFFHCSSGQYHNIQWTISTRAPQPAITESTQ
jgi:hypothetical protein